MIDLESVTVDKYQENWHPETLFNGYSIRCIIKKDDDVIGRLENLQNVKRILRRDSAIEGEDFLILQDIDGNGQCYFKDSTRLIMWKLRDNQSFNEIFSKIEIHGG